MDLLYKNILLLFLIGNILTNNLIAQQLPLFTQYREYHSYINPASISQDYFWQGYNVSLGASHRRQWTGLAESPTSIFFKGEYLLHTKASFDLSLGGYLLSMDTSPIRTNGVYGKIAALFTEDPYYGAFSLGFTIGALQYGVATDELIPFHTNDASIAMGNERQRTPDVGFGVYYYKQFRAGLLEGDVLYGGVSIPQLLGATVNFGNTSNGFIIEQKRHFYGVAGYYKYLDQSSFIEPSVWIRYVPNVPIQIDFLARYQKNRSFWVGVGAATSKTMHLEGGLFIGDNSGPSSFKVGYGFNYYLGGYGAVFGSAHEINVSFLLDTRMKETW